MHKNSNWPDNHQNTRVISVLKTIFAILIFFAHAGVSAAACSNIFECSSAGNLARLRQLVEGGSDDSAVNSSGQTPLDLALLRHRAQVIEFLVNRGAAYGRLDILKMRRLAQYVLHAGVSHFVTASKQCPIPFKNLPDKTQRQVLGLYHSARTDMGRWTLANSAPGIQLRYYLPRALGALREIHRAGGVCANPQLLSKFDITR